MTFCLNRYIDILPWIINFQVGCDKISEYLSIILLVWYKIETSFLPLVFLIPQLWELVDKVFYGEIVEALCYFISYTTFTYIYESNDYSVLFFEFTHTRIKITCLPTMLDKCWINWQDCLITVLRIFIHISIY